MSRSKQAAAINAYRRLLKLFHLLVCIAVTGLCVVGVSDAVASSFGITWRISNPQFFSAEQLEIVNAAVADAEELWEGAITGYQDGISLDGVEIRVQGTSSGFAQALITENVVQAGYRLSSAGTVWIALGVVDEFSDYEGSGTDFVDEIIAHEIGHVLGIGSLWTQNGVYVNGTGRYTGEHGVAAYRQEFDPDADFVPVELAGSPGTVDKHWNQLMRSSVQEGNPADPFSLSPLVGITDALGRDFAQDVMTGAIDPDFGEPFLSRTTVESLRDLGFTVRSIPEPSSGGLLVLIAAHLAMTWRIWWVS